jgi:hypothetical protein
MERTWTMQGRGMDMMFPNCMGVQKEYKLGEVELSASCEQTRELKSKAIPARIYSGPAVQLYVPEACLDAATALLRSNPRFLPLLVAR